MAGYGTALAFSPAARELKSGAFVTWGARIATQATQCLYLVAFEKEPALSFGPFVSSELPYMVPMEKRVVLLGLGVGPGLRHICPCHWQCAQGALGAFWVLWGLSVAFRGHFEPLCPQSSPVQSRYMGKLRI